MIKAINIIGVLLFMVSSCMAQSSLSKINQIDTLQYFSEKCNIHRTDTRKYINDSMYIVESNDGGDTMLIKGGCLFLFHKGAKYKLIDVEEDFKTEAKVVHYYYRGIEPKDTLQQTGESDIFYSLRLSQWIVIFVPVEHINEGGRNIYKYYVTGDCYPAVREKCIKAKIANGQYGVVFFEKGMGYTGHSKCNFMLTDESYERLLRRVK
jgi:hypothetical protein